MSPAPTRSRGFTRASRLLQTQIRKAGESRGFSVSRLLTHWEEIAGADIAGIAQPVEVSYARGGMGATLTVLTTGAQAPMLEMRKDALRERVNAAYGYNAIARVRITQTAASGFAEATAAFTPAAPAPTSPDVTAAARQATDTVHDPALRDALEALGRNVLSKPKS